VAVLSVEKELLMARATLASLEVRPLADEDLPVVVALENDGLPPERRRSVAQRRGHFTSQPTQDQDVLRLVAGTTGGPAVAYLEVIDYPKFPRTKVRCRLSPVVDSAHRRRGIGSALYERALAFAQERQAAILQVGFLQPATEGPGTAFLRRHGFRELEDERRLTSHLDLRTYDAARFSDLAERVEREGIHIVPCEALPDTTDNRRRLYDLFVAAGMIWDRSTFETWGMAPERWHWAQQALVIAQAADGAWVGFTQVAPYCRETGVWRTAHAATLPAFRNRGIGTALKLRSIALLRGRGCRVMLTANRLNNAPILAINRKLGYVPGPLELTYLQRLREAG
jgi:GNAT superfamily N-acetyltransferase